MAANDKPSQTPPKAARATKPRPDPQHPDSDRADVTERLRRIRDLLLGREAGPLTQTRDAVDAACDQLVKVERTVAALVEAQAAERVQIAALAVTVNAIAAAVGSPQSEKAVTFDVAAKVVPAGPGAPPSDTSCK